MSIFVLLVIGFLLLAFALVVPVFLKSKKLDDNQYDHQRQENINMARQRQLALQEIILDKSLSNEQAKSYEQEIEAVLLAESSTHQPLVANEKRNRLGVSLVVGSLLLLPICIYWLVGSPQALQNSQNNTFDQHTVIKRLKQRVQIDPNDVQAFYWLGRLALIDEDYSNAKKYLSRAYLLLDKKATIDELSLISAYINALLLDDARTNLPEIEQLLVRGFSIEDTNPTLLSFAALSAQVGEKPQEALSYWFKAHKAFANNPEEQQRISTLIESLEQRLPTVSQIGNNKDKKLVNIVITIDAPPTPVDNAVLFVFARQPSIDEGQKGPPLMVLKQKSLQWPLTVTLHAGLKMLPSVNLSLFEHYQIVARLSKSGNPIANSGDYFGVLDAVSPQATVNIDLNQTVP